MHTNKKESIMLMLLPLPINLQEKRREIVGWLGGSDRDRMSVRKEKKMHRCAKFFVLTIPTNDPFKMGNGVKYRLTLAGLICETHTLIRLFVTSFHVR